MNAKDIALIKALGGGGSGGSITVDSELSDTSTNPVQNKVIKSALDALVVQSDWNQNDDTQPDYVKNRPFWREKTKELLFPYITEPINVTTEDNGSGFFSASGDFDVAPGVTNYVVFDGVEYTCEPYYSEEDQGFAIGSLDFNDYPFFIAKKIIATKTAGNHTVLQYCDVYTIQTDYVPHLVIRTRKTQDRKPYLEMADVEKIKVSFEKGVPIALYTSYGNTSFPTRVNDVSENFIFASGFSSSVPGNIMEQAVFVFSVSDGSLYRYSVSYSGSIVENNTVYPLMYIGNERYKITVDSSGTLTATKVT